MTGMWVNMVVRKGERLEVGFDTIYLGTRQGLKKKLAKQQGRVHISSPAAGRGFCTPAAQLRPGMHVNRFEHNARPPTRL